MRSAFLGFWLFAATACGLRAYPPVKYVPLLGKERTVATTDVLIKALGDRDLSLRAQAVELLGVLSQSQNKKIKREVAQALGVALKDRDPGIRLQAVELLGKMEDRYANKYLLAALKDPNPFIRDQVIKVLSAREVSKLQVQAQAQTQAQTPPLGQAPP